MTTPINGPCTWPDDCPTPDDCAKGCLMPASQPKPQPAPGGVVHIAGVRVQVGALLRQRCAWCGTVLIDYDLARIAVPLGEDPTPATWPTGDLVLVDGRMSTVAPHVDGEDLPPNACARIDPEFTL
jgi:hypothetical protein